MRAAFKEVEPEKLFKYAGAYEKMLEYGSLSIEHHDEDLENLKIIADTLRSKMDETQAKGVKN